MPEDPAPPSAVLLTGRVLDERGMPASGLLVSAQVAGSLAGTEAPLPEPVRSSDDGTFVMPVQSFACYDVHAVRDGRSSHWRRVRVSASSPPPVQLVFAGAITLSGVVVDERGVPIERAGVQAWYEPEVAPPKSDADPSMQPAVWTDAEGRFTVAVSRYGRYRLIASADGHPSSSSVWAEPGENAANTESVLRLPAYATISGRVFGSDGSPLVGACVDAVPDGYVGLSWPEPTLVQQYGWARSARSGPDGSFVLQVPPGIPWTVVVQPGGQLDWRRVRRGGIAPGTAGLQICCREEELSGCAVRVFVTRDDDGPVDSLCIDCRGADQPIDLYGGSWGDSAKFEAGAWVLPPLPLGERYALLVSLPPERDANGKSIERLASTGVVFTTEGRELTLHLRLSPFASLPVRVAGTDADRLRAVRVVVHNTQPTGRWMFPRALDRDGLTFLTHLAAGAARLTVCDGFDVCLERDLWLAPGTNQEIVVRLPEDTTRGR